jgi:hypothetical protein
VRTKERETLFFLLSPLSLFSSALQILLFFFFFKCILVAPALISLSIFIIFDHSVLYTWFHSAT